MCQEEATNRSRQRDHYQGYISGTHAFNYSKELRGQQFFRMKWRWKMNI
jgi:hypothetical protein